MKKEMNTKPSITLSKTSAMDSKKESELDQLAQDAAAEADQLQAYQEAAAEADQAQAEDDSMDTGNWLTTNQNDIQTTLAGIKTPPLETLLPSSSMDAETLLKQSLDRTLAFYCELRQAQNDFQKDEFRSIEGVAVQYLQDVFSTLQSKEEALSYLNIYFQIYSLKQIQSRRLGLLNQYTDVIQFCEQEELFLDHSSRLTKSIAQLSRRLDDQINVKQNPKQNHKKVPSQQPSRPSRSLRHDRR
jgi:hypothetical protein